MSTYAIVLAGGSGQRMKSSGNKVLLSLENIPVLIRSILPFAKLCDGVILVIRPEDSSEINSLISQFGLEKHIVSIVNGGITRQDSVFEGLKALPVNATTVLVHDGARALVDEATIQRVLASVSSVGSGVAAIPVTDTIKNANSQGMVLNTIPREGLYAMQTPQGFIASDLISAHKNANSSQLQFTDDAAVMEYAGYPVHLTEGSRDNIKLTTPFDLTLASVILKTR